MDTFKNIPIHNIKNIALSGLTDEVFCRYINTVFKENNDSILIVTSSLFEANMLFGILSNYNDNVYLFPMDDFLTSEAIAISPDLLVNRLETLNEIVKNKTVLVIAHRLSTIKNADKICVMEDGRCIASGNHENLNKTCSEYQKLWEASVSASTWRIKEA